MIGPASELRRYADLTLAYTATSGGIRTYIDEKRRFIRDHTEYEHVLIIPGHEDRIETDGRLIVHSLRSPFIPGCDPYRFFWRIETLEKVLEEAHPDVLELGSFITCPWSAFRYRDRRRAAGHRCIVNGYFHTDIAEAYLGGPLRDTLGLDQNVDEGLWAGLGKAVADLFEGGAEQWFGSIFKQCDAVFAASEAQASRVREYGVEEVSLIPLGVDADLFHPARRSDAIRREIGVEKDDILCIYAGRLDSEKSVRILVEAFELLNDSRMHLIMMGEGSERPYLERMADELDRFSVLPYEEEKERFAAVLASADMYWTAGGHETFGLSVIEAQAAGLPVVGVAAGALRERVDPSVGRLAQPGDAGDFARAVSEVVAEREPLGKAAREKIVSGGYRWEDSFRKMTTICDDLWGRSDKPAV